MTRGGTRRRAGRPRLLTIERIVDTALELGLSHFTMARIAETLGVGFATLYQYVDSREQLLRLAVARKAETLPIAIDRGQDWPDYLIDYAQSLKAILTDHSDIMGQFIVSGFGIEAEMRIAERFMAALIARRFTPAEAARLFRATGYAAIAGAIYAHRTATAVERWDRADPAMRDALARLEGEGLRQLRAHAEVYVNGGQDLATDLLRPLINEITAARRERSPLTATSSEKDD